MGISANSSDQDRVSAAVGLPLLNLLHLFSLVASISLPGFRFFLLSIWLLSLFTRHLARWEKAIHESLIFANNYKIDLLWKTFPLLLLRSKTDTHMKLGVFSP